MPIRPQIITRDGPIAAPFTYELGPLEELRPMTAFAHWDGSAAASAFLPCLSFYSQDGKLFSRVFPSTPVAAGGVADVSYAPFPGGIGSSGSDTDDVLLNSRNDTTDPRYLFVESNQHGQATGIAGLNAPGVQFKSLDSYGVLLWTADANGRIVFYSPGASGGIRLISANAFRFYEDAFTNEMLTLTPVGGTNLFVLRRPGGGNLLVVSGSATATSITFYDAAGNQIMHMDSADQNLHIKTGKAVIADL